jgi:hypothetical protein
MGSQTSQHSLLSILVSSANLELKTVYLHNLFVLAAILIVREGLAQVKSQLLHGVPDGDHHSNRVRLES